MDKYQRPFNLVNRQGNAGASAFSSSLSSSKHQPKHSRAQQRQLSSRGRQVLTLLALVICLLFIRHQTAPSAGSQHLHDQPTYTIPTTCHAKLCNPSDRCSVWTPGHHDWTALVQQGVYRDLATIQVSDPGCVVALQVEDEHPDRKSRWVPITSGQKVECLQQCRNIVAMDIKSKSSNSKLSSDVFFLL